jgi:2-polyprenyl-3-methyl-5-hydroxy-6-metoxy-1,4-benzoquinol methylase
MPACLFCKKSKTETVFTESGIEYLRCLACGHLFSSFDRDQDYDGYFEDVKDENDAESYWNLAHDKMYTSFAMDYLSEKSGRLLDVGAGLGFFVKFASKVPGWQASGVEISCGGWKFGKERLGLQNYFFGRLEEQRFEPGSFDIITMWDVIEHIKDPHPILTKCFELLKEDGILFMHTPSGELQLVKARIKKALFGEKEGGHFLEAKDHLNLYSEKTLKKVLRNCGFKKVRFAHLPPIQAIAGKRDFMRLFLKNGWWLCAVALSKATLGKANMDNLFAEAKKR